MDSRAYLPSGTILDLPGMRCTIERAEGRGSNALVYQGYYLDRLQTSQRHRVLIKELFPYHPRGAVYRDEDGSVRRQPEGEELYETHRRSFLCGNAIHLRLLERCPELVGGNLNTYEYNHTLYTVLGFSGGRSLERELDAPAPPEALKTCAHTILNVLDALDAFHDGGYLHLDVSPDNILLLGHGRGQRVMLIDYNSAYREADLQAGQALYVSAKEGYAAPEVKTGALPLISKACDLYSVTAVFYRCLAGRPLSTADQLRPSPPDVSQCPPLRDAPETVKMMARRILCRGLSSVPAKRYRCAEDMRRDLLDLIERIDGLGVTHWALWEASMRDTKKMIRANPALRFLADGGTLYPLRGAGKDGVPRPIAQCFADLLKPGGGSALLTGAGGMGKTTALLQTVLSQGQRYAPAQTVAVYLSLYGRKAGDSSYILDHLLEGLRFKPDTASFDDARHVLRQLLGKPLSTREGERPQLFLLVDGLNEAEGSLDALLAELNELSALPGVRLVLTSRGETAELPFDRILLEPLAQEDVARALKERGVLPPEEAEMRELLRTPLLLSLYVQSALAGQRQPRPQTKDELLDNYLTALCEKEERGLGDGERWRIQAAVRFVLPALVREMERRRNSDEQLLPAVAKCYRLLSSRRMLGAFPQWIGHSRDIRGDAKTAEEWYGAVVHDLLWRRMGLLVRDNQGAYHIFHQTMGDYLLGAEAANARRIGKGKRLRACLALVCILAALAAGGWAFQRYVCPQPYNAVLADAVLTRGRNAYAAMNRQYASLTRLLAEPADWNLAECVAVMEETAAAKTQADDVAIASRMMEKGNVMPWSLQPFNQSLYQELIQRQARRAQTYLELLRVFDFLRTSSRGSAYLDDFVVKLSAVAAADADVNISLYDAVCAPHQEALNRADPSQATTYASVMADLDALSARRAERVATESPEQAYYLCLKALLTAEKSLESNAGFTAYEKENEK